MNTFITVFYDWSRIVAGRFAWAAPLAGRIVVGWVFLWTGWQKLHALPRMIENFRSWGIPAPEILTPFASGIEFVGGAMLPQGLRVPFVAVPVLTVLVVRLVPDIWGGACARGVRGAGGGKVGVRVPSATNEGAEAEIGAGRFREDLFYRLAVVPMRVPALKERREDVPVLARYFIARSAESSGMPERELSADALAALQAYDWPGNVRQLRNVMDWLLVMAPGGALDPIRADMLPPGIGSRARVHLQPAPGPAGGKVTCAGCGRHGERVLAGVPGDRRCGCRGEVSRPSR